MIDLDNKRVEVNRVDSFRHDLHVPENVRVGLANY